MEVHLACSKQLIAILLLTICGSAASEETVLDKCKYEFDATSAALGMRDHGKTKAEMEATLPPRESTLNDSNAVLLHEILDDIYSRPDVASFPYFHYRSLVCVTRAQGFNVTIPFENVADEMVACQNEHGTEHSEPLGNCILTAVQRHL